MSYSELVDQISKGATLPKKTVGDVLKVFAEEVRKAVMAGERVIIPRFGSFFPRDLKARPIFGGPKMSEPRRTMRFRERRGYGEAGSRAGRGEDEDGGEAERETLP